MTSSQPPAWKSPVAWVALCAPLVLGLALDLWSKSAVFDWIVHTDSGSHAIIPGVMNFTLSTNPGIVFGLVLPPVLVIIASILAIGAVLFMFVTNPTKARAAQIALGLILAGALGNLYDRLFSYVQLPGQPLAQRHVRDFIDFSDMYYPWIFNVADVLLVVGLGILIIAWTVHARREEAAARQVQQASLADQGKGRK